MVLEKKEFIQLSGEMYTTVKSSGIFKDSKTFVDSIPQNDPKLISELYEREKVKQSSMTGLIVVFSVFGGTSGSLIIGLLSQNYLVHSAFYFPLIPIALLGFLLFPYKKLTDKYGEKLKNKME